MPAFLPMVLLILVRSFSTSFLAPGTFSNSTAVPIVHVAWHRVVWSRRFPGSWRNTPLGAKLRLQSPFRFHRTDNREMGLGYDAGKKRAR